MRGPWPYYASAAEVKRNLDKPGPYAIGAEVSFRSNPAPAGGDAEPRP